MKYNNNNNICNSKCASASKCRTLMVAFRYVVILFCALFFNSLLELSFELTEYYMYIYCYYYLIYTIKS